MFPRPQVPWGRAVSHLLAERHKEEREGKARDKTEAELTT